VAGDRRAVLARDVAGAVARAVVDDEDRGLDAADRLRDARQDLADVVLLVVGRDDDGDLVLEALGQPYEAPEAPDLEVRFGDALEDAAERVLAALRT
jgi:hypothetical protein